MRARWFDLGLLTGSLLLSGRALAEGPGADLAQSFDLMATLAVGTPLTSDQAAQRAQEASPSIERADALMRAAEAAVERVRVQLWPRLELSARYTHIDGFPDAHLGGLNAQQVATTQGAIDQVTDPAARQLFQATLNSQQGGQVIKIPRNQGGFAARLSWPVSDLFFAVYPSIDAARSSARASQADREARQARVRLSAREAYFQLAHARGNLAVAQRALLQTRAQQERIDAGVRVGLRPPSEAASAASRVASAEQSVSYAETAVDVADAALRSMLQDREGPAYAISEPVLVAGSEPAALNTLLEKARTRRPEVRALEAALAARSHFSKADKAAGYPHLAVYAGGDYALSNRYVIPPLAEFKPSWEVGASLSYAPNDTFAAQRKASENSAQIAALQGELGELLRALDLEVRRSRVTLAHAQRNIDAGQAAVQAAQAAYDRRMAELGAGEVVLADVIAAEQELNAARLRVLDAGIEQQLARVRLAYAVGE